MIVNLSHNLPKISCRYYVKIFWGFLHYKITNTTTNQVDIISSAAEAAEDVPRLVGDHGLLDPEPLRAHLLPLRPLRPACGHGGGGGVGVGGRGGRGAAAATARGCERGEGGGRDAAGPGERA